MTNVYFERHAKPDYNVHDDFEKMRMIMPWIVKKQFGKNICRNIAKIDIFFLFC
ncbi:hypothetical protein [Acetivibrio straminisolvens]|uniref:Uncharacterized protein n=1 Tax=Acetivibrio straminisolvens JCM 21531 TaxID=1294263 RepID=W4V230_9FIRM|nr:hypothetical protein [Acetivibrio straminisolvens]GAE87177.1 hypothetical protein JCM21531_526 [Acetivibrio straminisolvens JCM 21531]